MQLSERELEIIRAELQALDPDGEIYLFGPRATDNAGNGDIDLFFETTNALDSWAKLGTRFRLAASCKANVKLLVKVDGEQEKLIHTIARKGVRL